MKKQFNLTTGFGDQIWYLDTRDRSDEILSGRIWPMRLHLHRTDGPAAVWTNGTQVWWLNNKRHRTDGPAIVWADGDRSWWVDGKCHRTDGPAVVRADGRQMWWINNKGYYNNKAFQKAAKITDEEMMIMIIKYGNVK